jgi:hypothetical protein
MLSENRANKVAVFSFFMSESKIIKF